MDTSRLSVDSLNALEELSNELDLVEEFAAGDTDKSYLLGRLSVVARRLVNCLQEA